LFRGAEELVAALGRPITEPSFEGREKAMLLCGLERLLKGLLERLELFETAIIYVLLHGMQKGMNMIK